MSLMSYEFNELLRNTKKKKTYAKQETLAKITFNFSVSLNNS